MKKETLIFTNDKCIGCNKCIKVCSAAGACISTVEEDRSRIVVDGTRCIVCGRCIDVCEHGAREYWDDTERFFCDLKNGENISLLIAPAFKANYPEEYEKVLGGLKELGVNRMINVAFGADITTWGYLNYIEKYQFTGGISEPCPVVVAYIERYLPELLPKLFPVQSPLMSAAIYARKELGITDKFAFISPCIAKKMEIEDPHNEGLVQYNVTFSHLMEYVKKHQVYGTPVHSEIEYGLGAFYPVLGGLSENIHWFLGEQIYTRQIEGERRLYRWLNQNKERIREGKTSFLLIDALNCENGCICGTAVDMEKARTDDALLESLKIREQRKKEIRGDVWSRYDTPRERLDHYNEQFAGLRLEDYLREYTDCSADCAYDLPNEQELEEIFISMDKFTEESRQIDCACCGYDSCKDMAVAIFNGVNHKQNCIHYEQARVRQLEMEKAVAEEATAVKNALLANVSHEVRTPINAMLGMGELIFRESGEEKIREYAESMKHSGHKLLSFVENVLDYSEIEAGQITLHYKKYDLAEFIYENVSEVEEEAEKKGLVLRVETDEEIPRFLYGDIEKIRRCILNLLLYSLKYTKKGEICLSIRLKEWREGMVMLQMGVKDTGEGIEEEMLKHLFTSFAEVDARQRKRVNETDLGLSIIQKILVTMESSLEVDSECGKGSFFRFTIQQKYIGQERLGDVSEKIKRFQEQCGKYYKSFVAPGAKVLIVDDMEMNLVVVKGLLRETEIQVDMASSAEEGLNLLQKIEYDVLLFDYMMPKMDGSALLHEVRHSENPNREKPCLVLTANAVSGVRERYLRDGFDDYISKPVDGKILEQLLLKYLPIEKVMFIEREHIEEGIAEQTEKWYAGLEGIEREKGLENCGSLKGYKEILTIFYNSIDDKVSMVEELYKAEKWKEYAIQVHAMKSSARTIGAMRVGVLAQELENAGKEENISYIHEKHENLISEFWHLKEVLKNVCEEKEEAVETQVLESGDFRHFCREFHMAAKKMDYDVLENLFKECKLYVFSEEEKIALRLLEDSFEEFDYEKIQSLSEEWEKKFGILPEERAPLEQEKASTDVQPLERLSTVSAIYLSAYEINILEDTYMVISSMLNMDTRIGERRPGAQEVLYRALDQFVAKDYRKFVYHFMDLSTLVERLGKQNNICIEYHSHLDKWCRGRFVISRRTPDGRISHVLWVVEDISAEKKKREELDEYIQRLNTQMSTLGMIYISMHDIDILNDTFIEIRVADKDVSEFLAKKKNYAQQMLFNIMDVMAAEDSREMIRKFVDLRTMDERLANVDTITEEFLDYKNCWRRGRFIVSERTFEGKVSHVLWLVEDIDVEKRRRERLRDLSIRAIAANEAKSAFLSNMSHEIRTPLTAVLGMNEMILRECADEAIVNYAENIQTAGNVLLGIINDILDFSKIEAGKMEIIPVDYEMASLINDLVNMIQTRLDEKGIEMKLAFDKDIPNLLHGDETRIKQCITNMLTNAAKYTEKGTVTFSMSYTKIPEEPDYIMLRVSVKDTGIGIRKEDMSKIFMKFDRIEEERNRHVEGTGLGMAITQNLLNMMGTLLEVQSEYGKGSEFYFSLRQKVVKWDPMGDYVSTYRKSISEHGKYKERFIAPEARVLAVDDTEINIQVFQNLLKKTKIQIDTATSGDAGIALAMEKKYDIIFLDHMMPKKNGVETLKELKALEGHPNVDTPVVCLTANAISGMREKYLSLGFDDYLTKPIHSMRLEEMLIAYLPEEKVFLKQSAEEEGTEVLETDGTDVETGTENFVSKETAVLKENGIDVEAGIKNCGTPASYRQILRIFFQSIRQNHAELERLYQKGNWSEYVVKVHAVKSSARTIGAADFGEQAQALEDAGKRGDVAYIRDKHPKLLSGLMAMLEVLEEVCTPQEGYGKRKDGEALNPEKISLWHERLRNAARLMDADEIEAVLSEMEQSSLPEEEKEIYEQVKERCDEFDYEGIGEVLIE